VILVYILAKKLVNDYRIGLLTAILTATSVRYISRTAAFCSELMGHLLIPVILLFLYRGLRGKDDRNLFISGLLLAGLILSHHLSSAVILIVLALFSFLLLVTKRKEGLLEVKKILFVLAIGLIISFPFWVKLAEGGIFKIVVKEAYAREGMLNLSAFFNNIGIPQFILGVLGIAYAVYKRRTEHLLLIAWALPLFLGLWDRDIATFLFKDNLLKSNPDLIYVFSPSLNTRYYDFLGQPLSILAALFFFFAVGFLDHTKRLKKTYAYALILLALFFVFILMPLPVNSRLFYGGSGYGWLKWALVSLFPQKSTKPQFGCVRIFLMM
jgi:hypothetical protein